MGGLKAEIADGIKMFKPKSLKEAISLARMRDDQVSRQRKFTKPIARIAANSRSSTPVKNSTPMKRFNLR